MTDEQIIEEFDGNLSLTLAQLSRMSGRSVAYIKQLLLTR
jgi:hypothetical protein